MFSRALFKTMLALACLAGAAAAAAAATPGGPAPVEWHAELARLVERQDAAGLVARFAEGGTLRTDRRSEPVSGGEALLEAWNELLGGGAVDTITRSWGSEPIVFRGGLGVARTSRWTLFGPAALATADCPGRLFARAAEEVVFDEEGRVASMTVRLGMSTRWIKEELECDRDDARMVGMMDAGLYEVEDTVYAVGDGVAHLSAATASERFSSDPGALAVELGDGPAGVAATQAEVRAVYEALFDGLRHASAMPWDQPWANVDSVRTGTVPRTYALVHQNGCATTFDALELYELDDMNQITRMTSRWSKSRAQVRAELLECPHRGEAPAAAAAHDDL